MLEILRIFAWLMVWIPGILLVVGVLVMGAWAAYYRFWQRYPGISQAVWRAFADAHENPEQRAGVHALIDRRKYTEGMRFALSLWMIDVIVNERRLSTRTVATPVYFVSRKRDRVRQGYVYLMHSTASGLYKIGRSINAESRRKELSTASGDEIRLVWHISTTDMDSAEKNLHQRFAAKRVKGEWFSLDTDDVAWIQALEGV